MFVAKWYTRASRVRIVIAKFDGRWKLPGGPYPIPELVALVGGILVTLFLLPRLGQPLMTAVVGLAATAIAVGVMRKMPYSPVKFGTRIHRIYRLYTSPVSVSGGDDTHALNTVSTVRPQIEILDWTEPASPYARQPRHQRTPSEPDLFAATPDTDPWTDAFAPQRSSASDLFAS
ncbi:hypothetical protein QRB38_13550 [Mycobacterium avium subsp. hominissuis]|uniref:hypothetical protein n=1 Tax=Mycobacterium avium TaxID=1764 RepID=UPI0026650585|nr:hypothetical protein [Mycobacterium avium]MDO2394837.1 hypothetical protein [Mycobacterium avium subsp. hominissuis]